MWMIGPSCGFTFVSSGGQVDGVDAWFNECSFLDLVGTPLACLFALHEKLPVHDQKTLLHLCSPRRISVKV